ncbi:DUF6538 domain-containing protein [Dongia deserti]|uniref:DUF6538 domain-containing protein n=1 Tax=Dongia deserti TaxID=2268030 RepID=UPI000E65BEBE|nr:tyrosine-type recombinase/integrase [Dongia deserti]
MTDKTVDHYGTRSVRKKRKGKSHEMPDNRHLQKRRQGWYVRVAVPESLWKTVGKEHIIKSLKTRDVAEARQLRWIALSDIKTQLAEAQRQLKGGGVPRGIDLSAWEIEHRQWYQDVLKRCPQNGTGPDDDNELDLADLVLTDIADEVEEAHGLRRAKQFVEFVRNTSAPIEATKTAWLKQITDTVAEQTRAQHEVAVAALVKHDPSLMFVADVTRKKAGTFVEWMDQSSGRKRATVNRYISSLSSFWRWMIKRGITESNPWSGQMLAKKARGASNGAKRPYANEELVKLLSVSAKDIRRGNYAQAIHDLMRLGLLTGARLNELCSLVAANIDATKRSLSITDGKTQSATRVIPLHDLVWPIVARRLQAAQGNGPLFPELTPGGPDKKRSWKVSSHYAAFRQKVLGEDDTVDFHSFRRNFATHLERAQKNSPVVNPSSIAELMGHKKSTLALSVYSGGLAYSDLKTAMDEGAKEIDPRVLQLI